MKLEIITGDITKIKCDAIVCPVNQRLGNSKGISSVIHQAIGKTYLKPTSVDISIGRCFVTTANKLPFRKVIYTVFPYINPFYDPYELFLSRLPECYQNAVHRALAEGCTSVAFPLLGAWDEIFPLEKVMDIALSSIETIMQDNLPELSIYLVLTDKQSALMKNNDNGKCKSTANDKQSDEVLCLNKRWISLCKVNRPDRNRDIWLLRLADAIEGSLVAPSIDDKKEQTFDNRRLIFREDGPDTPDSIGFWEWKERKSDSGRWWSDATYMEETKPVEVVVLDKCSSVEQIVDMLKSGLHIPAYLSGNVLFAVRKHTAFVGLLCNIEYFNVRPGKDLWAVLKDTIYTLPYYEVDVSDIFTWNDRKIYKYISFGEPKKRFPIHIPVQLLKQLFLQRMSWPVFKAQGIVKGDWQKIKQFFNEIPDNTILETVSQTYSMSAQEAQSCVNAFLKTIESHIDVEDIDSSLIIQILDNHEGIKLKLDGIAQKKWQEEHQAEVKQAQVEIAAMRNAAEQEVAAAKQRLLEVEESVAGAETKYTGILSEIATSEAKLNRLIEEIEQYESLGNDAMEAVRSKIAEAQKDMAGFIAELSVVLPQPQVQQEPVKQENKRLPVWRYDAAPDYEFDNDEIEISSSWNEEYAQLCDNLSRSLGIDGILCDMLAAFLYAANNQNEPLLIAGPGGREIGNAFSGSMFAARSGHLTLENESDSALFDTTRKFSEKVITIHNMFHKGWSATLLQDFARSEKQILWSHPYVEDLAIEPKELYSYALPLLSECFVVDLPQNRHPFVNPNFYAKRAENFKAYRTGKKKPLRLSAWKRLKLSKMVLNRMERILSDVKQIMDQESYAKDIEILLGILPMAVLTGKREILKDLLEEEKNISREVRAEVERYIEEE